MTLATYILFEPRRSIALINPTVKCDQQNIVNTLALEDLWLFTELLGSFQRLFQKSRERGLRIIRMTTFVDPVT